MEYIENFEWKKLYKEKKYKEAAETLNHEMAVNLLRVHNLYSDVKYDPEKEDYVAYDFILYAHNSKKELISEIKDFYDFTRGCVLSGHNVIGFDIKFIRREGESIGLVFDNELIDTLNEARMAKLKITRYNLGTVVKALGLTLEGAHRAWNDAYATAQVLLKLNEVS